LHQNRNRYELAGSTESSVGSIVEVLELVANDLPVLHRVDEPGSLHTRDFARVLPRVGQSIERADATLAVILELTPLFRDVETLCVSESRRHSPFGGAAPPCVPPEDFIDSVQRGYTPALRDNPLDVVGEDLFHGGALEVRCPPAVDDLHRVAAHAERLRKE